MKKSGFLAGCVGLVLLIGCASGHKESREEPIAAEQVPQNVMAAFHRDFPGAQLQSIQKETYPSGTIHYEFKFINHDKQQEEEFNTDGVLLEAH